MSDKELEAIKRRKLLELQKRLTIEEQKEDQKNEGKILNKAFRGRAWEVFNTACVQFPREMTEVENMLVKLVLSGKISQMTGEQLFAFLRMIGLPIRLKTKINILSHGKAKSLSETFKEKTK